MLSRWPIRNKLLLGLALLLGIVSALSWSGLHGLYVWRELLKDLGRVGELPVAVELNQRAGDLRVGVLALLQAPGENTSARRFERLSQVTEFRERLMAVQGSLRAYETELSRSDRRQSLLGHNEQERQDVAQASALLTALAAATAADGWPDDKETATAVRKQVAELEGLTAVLPQYLLNDVNAFPAAVQDRRRFHVTLTWSVFLIAAALLSVFAVFAYRGLFRPLRLLIHGTRNVAAGDYSFRIQLHCNDEMNELADTFNRTTARFQSIRDNLDRQVEDRTRQVVRSEQLAGVGFLAAGVAHEINQPIAAIRAATSRLRDALENNALPAQQRRQALLTCLAEVQEKAFACKEITQGLLEFARVGDGERRRTDLRELAQDVIRLVQHVGRYQQKHVALADGPSAHALADVPQVRQVLLNLLAAALDRVRDGGQVSLEVRPREDGAEVLLTDDGRPYSPRERAAIFDPAGPDAGDNGQRSGLGDGLGLAVSACVVRDHGGDIQVGAEASDARFRVVLPAPQIPLQSSLVQSSAVQSIAA